MKRREELAVAEEWQADRITFRFRMHPRRQRLVIYASIALCVAAMAGGVALVLLQDVEFLRWWETQGVLRALGVLAVISFLASMLPLLFWPLFDAALVVSLSPNQVQIGKRKVWRSEVRHLRVVADRLVVELEDGTSIRTPALMGLSHQRVSQAFAYFDPTDPDLEAERRAASEARRCLDPIVAASQGSAK